MGVKIVFLDIDGVLNYEDSTSRNGLYLGIDEKRLRQLKRIVRATGAKIVLTSTWRIFYNLDTKEQTEQTGKYLANKFRRAHLKVYGKTPDIYWAHRGDEIKAWLEEHTEVDQFVILDDEMFNGYEKYNYMQHFIKTIYRTENEWAGLTPYLANRAIDILNGNLPETGPTIDKGFRDFCKLDTLTGWDLYRI